MTPRQRKSLKNGIWLCQIHAKLVDDDSVTYTVRKLHEWKDLAENMARLEVRGYVVQKASPFPELDRKAPEVVRDIREALKEYPLIREFVVYWKRARLNVSEREIFRLDPNDHPDIRGIINIMLSCKAIIEKPTDRVTHYILSEEFVAYLIGES